ncbi:MAG TPA: hypothetical protein VFC07_14480, partial [Verrucomicrobiae bacterium]|nr:hypothetical protein [Verrucomicrobiae bacterium]
MKVSRQCHFGRITKAAAIAAVVALAAVLDGRAADVQGDLIVPATPAPAPAASAPASTSTNATAAVSTNSGPMTLADLLKSTVPADESKRAKDTAGFDKLSAFPFKVTDEMILGIADSISTSLEISKQIPDSVRKLNHQQVSVTGFMMPTKMEDGLATEFLLLKNRGLCCYGTQPALNEYVT